MAQSQKSATSSKPVSQAKAQTFNKSEKQEDVRTSNIASAKG